jgi:orotate phosphoribosyltransferase
LGNQIEGQYQKGQKIVVLEDLISTGKSSLQVVEVLRQNGLEVVGMVSIFNYRFDQAKEAFEKQGVSYVSLTDYPTLLEMARSKGLVPQEELDVLLKWSADPANWQGLS